MAPTDGKRSPLPPVTVTILVHNPGSHEVRAVKLVRDQDYAGGVEVLVLDSSPDCDPPSNVAIRKESDDWVRIEPGDFSHSGTRNRAAELVTAPLIVYLSQDAHLADRSAIANLVRPIVDGDAVAAYGRQIAPAGTVERSSTFDYLYPDHPIVKTLDDVGRMGIRTFHFSDVFSAFDSSLLRTVRFPPVEMFEDVAIAKELLRAGHALAYVPDARVMHEHLMSPAGVWARYRTIGRVYEELGIFREVRKAKRFRGSRAGGSAASTLLASGAGPVALLKSGALLGLKAAAVAAGRISARRSAS